MEFREKQNLKIRFRIANFEDERDVLALGSFHFGFDSISYEFGKLIINPAAICTVCLLQDKVKAFSFYLF